MSSNTVAVDVDVVIIGGGMSGIGLAVQLKRKFTGTTFKIFEKLNDVGGTWAVNTYPGCGVDVPSHFYSYSFALNPDWSQKFVMQPELLSYFHSVAHRWDLMKDTYLQHTVQQATWDGTTSTWVVQIVDHVQKRSFTARSLAVVSAVGALSTPKKCDVPGHEEFEGKIFHSAQWDHSFDQDGKDILVLGNGCSATQFVPVLSQSARTVAQVARQPHWLLERPNPKYSPTFKAAMRYIPGLMRLLRAKIFAELESEWPMFDSETGGVARAQLAKASEEYIRKVAPPKYVESLVPKFEVGCKRRVFDSDYLACLHQKNVELIHNDQVDRLTKTSAIFRSGRELKIDAVVLATGFETTALLSHLNIVGRNGISIQDHWRKHNDGFPQAYYGTCVAGFPNFFVMMGPNTVTGHSSVIFSSECQINFALNMLEPVLGARRSRSIAAVEVTQQAEDQENSWIQQRAKGLVWSSGCSNWYVEPKTGKNLMVYPEWQWHYWLRSFAIDYSKFAYTGQDDRVLHNW
ncbi:putative flavin-binding monooxygenase [Cadophora sp. MPI-SDFR-AT-0126]|nr:putative flavin-binding monooxygenase [Leotiomycetes sp. MPI-SDFR-AT-0126]